MSTQEFHVRDLKTRSVTLYPARAQVVREVSDIFIQPGANQIVVVGLTPTIDEHSIKVTGTGSGTITDLTLELVANKESYEDVYPEESEDEDAERIDSSDEEPAKAPDLMGQELTEELNRLEALLAGEQEKILAAEKKLAFLDKYGSSASMADAKPTEVQSFLKIYSSERAGIFIQHQTAKAVQCDLQEKKVELQQRKTKMLRKAIKAAAKANKIKAKKAQEKARRLAEVEKEKQRVKNERSQFWPKRVYKLTINIDAPSGRTPAGSRRGSAENLAKLAIAAMNAALSDKVASEKGAEPAKLSLSVSYITCAAFWAPRYDLSLNSARSSGALDFCAGVHNMTSETWKESKVLLSTSQTAYQELDESILTLQPWHLRLTPAFNKHKAKAALYSEQEQIPGSDLHKKAAIPSALPRHELFGLAGSSNSGANMFQRSMKNVSNLSHVPPPMWAAPRATSSQSVGSAHFGSLRPRQVFGQQGSDVGGGALFGMPSGSMSQVQVRRSSHTSALFANESASSGVPVADTDPYEVAEDIEKEEGGECADEVTLGPSSPELIFEESSLEEMGLTTTYELPNLKTLNPASVASKHKIIRIDFKDIIFSRVLIPKLKTSAFLKARIQNASKVTLLKGTASLTLDNSFLGQSSIPRCSAGDSFTLPLGIDPAITVQYAQPTVQRSQSGLFKAETTEIYTRTTSIMNTKSDAMVELTVLEHVPVSGDERLRIELNCPNRLRVGGDSVPAGRGIPTPDQSKTVTARESSTNILNDDKGARNWGSATAMAKKDGEVAWKVKINPSRECKLVLEYIVTYPSAESIAKV